MVVSRLARLLLVLLLTACTVALPGQPSLPTGRIAFVTDEGGIATIPQSGGEPTVIVPGVPAPTVDALPPRRYAWPIWSPDGQRIAFMAHDRDGAAGAVYVAAADGQQRLTLFERADSYPIYLTWSPDGTALTLLVGGNEMRRLLVAAADGRSEPRQLSVGRTIYSAWAPDSQALLVHVDDLVFGASLSQVYLIPMAPDASIERVDIDGNSFRAPAWSPAATYQALAGDNGVGSDALFLRDQDGRLRRFEDTGHAPAMAWSPSGRHLAWADGPAAPFRYDSLHIADLGQRARRQVITEPLFAFFWSPDSTRLAYLTLDADSQSLQWRVIPVHGDEAARTVATFQPTREFVHLLSAFDQHHQSISLWSPDSQSLLYAGWPPGAERSEPPGLYTVAVDGGAAPRRLTTGRIGFFPPARGTPQTPTPAARGPG